MDVLGSLKAFLRPDKVCVDNCIFRICTKTSFVILIAVSLLVTSRQYIGDPIDCIVDEIPNNVMDTYCWFYSTYTLTNRLTGIAGRDMVMPGVASETEINDTIKYHRYYQWVCFALFFQALACYLPRYLWKSFEGGRIKALSEELKQSIIDETTKEKRKTAAINYIKENLNQQSFYAYRFFLCELLNFGIAIGQVFFTNYFLDGEFMNYGIEVLRSNDVSPMTRIFPKMTKCTFHKYGPSGTVQKFDGLCVLPVNNIKEKIYFFLWFWFFGTSILSAMAIVHRVLVCTIPKLRFFLLRTRARLSSRQDLEYILHQCEIGDWFILYQLSKNIDPLNYKEICRDLSHKLYHNF